MYLENCLLSNNIKSQSRNQKINIPKWDLLTLIISKSFEKWNLFLIRNSQEIIQSKSAGEGFWFFHCFIKNCLFVMFWITSKNK